MQKTDPWWQSGIIYQIYPRSYQDSNNDGIGDLNGIRRRLDYIQSLGVQAVWLSPIYPSPMRDFGYDVADYTGIHPMFGTMADFDALLDEIHRRGLKLILDLVPNHTSDEHPWFIESRSSRDNPKWDWYIWADPAPDGGPPNNWLSYFGGPAWTFDQTTGQYYLHQFVSQQPELNYRHPDVLPAMQDVMRFWLDKGVDGFRVDVIWLMMKDELLRDEPANPEWDGVDPHASLRHIYTQNLSGVHDLVRQIVEEYESLLPPGGWPNWVLGNHDQHRIATRVGPAQARIANMLLLTLRGTPTTYYGEEIGMENGRIPPEFVQDPPAVNQPEIAHIIGRDPARTPMQWDDSPHAGFTAAGVQPWLPVAGNYPTCNVAQQEADPTSMLNLYRALTQLRQCEPALSVGDYGAVDTAVADIFAYQRTAPGADRFLILLNFGSNSRTLDLSHLATDATIAVASDMQRSGPVNLAALALGPHEGLLLRLSD
jgi:alpha-glucosidase